MIEILLAVIGILLAILIPLIKFLYDRNKKINAFYEIVWEKSSSLKQNKLLRGRPFSKYYYQRPQDDLLRQLLIDKKNILVIGSPLAGKTRAVYQALTHLNKPYDIIIPNCVDIDIESFLLPKHIMFWRPKLIIIDDLHRFVENKNFNHLFKISMESNIIVIATCRSGIEYKKVKKIMLDNNIAIETIFDDNIIEYDKITKEIGNEIANEAGIDWNKVKFTGTIGSIFMHLGEMERRFDGCSDSEKTILRNIKKLYISGIYERKYSFPLNCIKIVNKKTGLILENFKYDKWLDSLEEKEFLKFQEDMVLIDEIYLENIVILKKTDLAIFEEMKSIFLKIPDVLFKIGKHAYEKGIVELEKAEYMNIAIQAYEEALKDEDKVLRRNAASALGRTDDPRAVKALIVVLKDGDKVVCRNAASALGAIGDPRAVEALIEALEDEDADLRRNAAKALGHIGDPRAVKALIEALEDANKNVRRNAALALGRIGDPRAFKALEKALKGEDVDLRVYAERALKQIEAKQKSTSMEAEKYPSDK